MAGCMIRLHVESKGARSAIPIPSTSGNVEYGRKERDTSRSKDILIFCASAHTVRAPVTLSERNTQNPQPGLKTLGLNLVFK